MVQVLREKTNMLTRDLVGASPFFAGKPGLIDLAICDVSTNGGRQDIFHEKSDSKECDVLQHERIGNRLEWRVQQCGVFPWRICC